MTFPADPSKLRELDDIDVLRLPYLAVAEARRRGLVTTWDLPSGGYAEALALAVFGGTAWGAAGIGHDLTDPLGRRVEVKAVAAGHSTSPAHPANFDALCLVRLDPENLNVRYAVLMPTDVAVELGRPHARGGISLRATNGLPSVRESRTSPTCSVQQSRGPAPTAGLPLRRNRPKRPNPCLKSFGRISGSGTTAAPRLCRGSFGSPRLSQVSAPADPANRPIRRACRLHSQPLDGHDDALPDLRPCRQEIR